MPPVRNFKILKIIVIIAFMLSFGSFTFEIITCKNELFCTLVSGWFSILIVLPLFIISILPSVFFMEKDYRKRYKIYKKEMQEFLEQENKTE